MAVYYNARALSINTMNMQSPSSRAPLSRRGGNENGTDPVVR